MTAFNRIPLAAVTALNALCASLALGVGYYAWTVRQRAEALERRVDEVVRENERLDRENIELMRERSKAQRDCIDTINKIYGAKKHDRE